MFAVSSRSASAVFFHALVLAAVLGSSSGFLGAHDVNPPVPAPDFTRQDAFAWINSKPLTLRDLRGKVVLLDFWTFDCWNCYRSFPWLKSLEGRFESKGLRVIGVHTPEFAHEKVKSNVMAKIKEFGLHRPVMMDNDFAYWNAMGNRFWPAYLSARSMPAMSKPSRWKRRSNACWPRIADASPLRRCGR
jgi:thiol-disulfide isomerase/thioredoxin